MAKMHLRYGAMNSGKSSRIINEAYNYESQGFNVVISKPAIDTKAGDKISARNGNERKVDLLIGPQDVIVESLAPFIAKNTLKCVFVDEAQFLQPRQVDEFYWEVSEDMGIPVIAYGLRADFLSIPFPASERLMALADEIEEIPTLCRCGHKARLNTRLVDGEFVFEGSQVAIDGEGVQYESLCKTCYRREKLAYLATKGSLASQYSSG